MVAATFICSYRFLLCYFLFCSSLSRTFTNNKYKDPPLPNPRLFIPVLSHHLLSDHQFYKPRSLPQFNIPGYGPSVQDHNHTLPAGSDNGGSALLSGFHVPSFCTFHFEEVLFSGIGKTIFQVVLF